MNENETEEFHENRRQIGLTINPDTAEVMWTYGYTLDPYGLEDNLPEEARQIGRTYFARSPGSGTWVWFGDLPGPTEDALRAKHKSKLAFPAGLSQIFGMAALMEFWSAILTGTQQALELVLAPECQIQRSDGSGFDRQGFLESERPKLVAMPEFTEVKVTGNPERMVVRYCVTANETIGGKTVEKHAPRLTVFRQKANNGYLVVAHSNFATLTE
jgi:hypothetical protein